MDEIRVAGSEDDIHFDSSQVVIEKGGEYDKYGAVDPAIIQISENLFRTMLFPKNTRFKVKNLYTLKTPKTPKIQKIKNKTIKISLNLKILNRTKTQESFASQQYH